MLRCNPLVLYLLMAFLDCALTVPATSVARTTASRKVSSTGSSHLPTAYSTNKATVGNKTTKTTAKVSVKATSAAVVPHTAANANVTANKQGSSTLRANTSASVAKLTGSIKTTIASAHNTSTTTAHSSHHPATESSKHVGNVTIAKKPTQTSAAASSHTSTHATMPKTLTTKAGTLTYFVLPSNTWIGDCSIGRLSQKVVLNVTKQNSPVSTGRSGSWHCSLVTPSCVSDCTLQLALVNVSALRTNISLKSTGSCKNAPICTGLLQGNMTMATDLHDHNKGKWRIDANGLSLRAAIMSEALHWLDGSVSGTHSQKTVAASHSMSRGAVATIVLFTLLVCSALLAALYVYMRNHCLLRMQYSSRRLRDGNVFLDEDREQSYLFAL